MKKALLVRINDYQRPRINDLSGCVNDVLEMGDIILNFYEFERRNVEILTDGRATRANILEGLDRLTKDAKRGDVLLFHYSGHGSQIPDIGERDEEDHLDECICPADTAPYNFEEACIIDDELNERFSGLSEGVNLTVILDSCHSGTATREISGELGIRETRIGKFLPPPPDLAWEIDERMRGRRKKFGIDVNEERNILLAACRENQTSADAFISGGYHGAFTYFLVDTIKEVFENRRFSRSHDEVVRKNGSITYRELVEKTGEKLEKNGFEQIPQLEGQERYFNDLFLSSVV
jgi:hypothetical protein